MEGTFRRASPGRSVSNCSAQQCTPIDATKDGNTGKFSSCKPVCSVFHPH